MKRFLCLCVLTLLSGCTNLPQPQRAQTQYFSGDFPCPDSTSSSSPYFDHVLRVNRDGLIIDATKKKIKPDAEPLPDAEAEHQIKTMLCNAERLAGNGRPVKILVMVHGGLNKYKDTDEKIKKGMHQTIKTDGDDWHYPIFISWPSDALSTWRENTFSIREGKKTNQALGLAGSPFVITADVLTSVGRFPITAFYQVANEKDRIASAGGLPKSWLSASWKASQKQLCGTVPLKDCAKEVQPPNPPQKIKANLSTYHTKGFNKARNGVLQALTLPVRYTVGSVWHSSISTSSWENMKRRTRNMFYPTGDFDDRRSNSFRGGYFFNLLLARAIHKKNYEITLVGHSMGTIVLNHTLGVHQNEWIASKSLSNIVYMGAACSIADAVKTLKPILEAGKRKVEISGGDVASVKNKTVKENDIERTVNFYNLTLNRVSEVAEMHVGGLIPTGSLLVSIDQHFDHPNHPMARTMGSEVNVLSALATLDNTFADAKGEVVFKAFDRYNNTLPAKHGDFNKIPFWKKSTWALNTDKDETPGKPF